MVITVTATPPSSSPRFCRSFAISAIRSSPSWSSPLPVDREHPVAVAVVGEADLGAGGADELDQALGMSRAAVGVDVAAVGLRADQLQLGAERAEDRRGGPVGRPVGAVEGDSRAGEIELEGAAELADVVVEGALELAHAPDPLAGRVVEARLDRGLGLVVELDPPRVEELDPVVGVGIVGGRDDPRQVEAQPARQHRGGRRGQDAAQHRVPAARRDPRREGLLEHRPGLAGVADDQDLRTLGARPAVLPRGRAARPDPA